eukprot:2278993-Rhodomonas_salina.1
MAEQASTGTHSRSESVSTTTSLVPLSTTDVADDAITTPQPSSTTEPIQSLSSASTSLLTIAANHLTAINSAAVASEKSASLGSTTPSSSKLLHTTSQADSEPTTVASSTTKSLLDTLHSTLAANSTLAEASSPFLTTEVFAAASPVQATSATTVTLQSQTTSAPPATPETAVDTAIEVAAHTTPYASAMTTVTSSPEPFQQLFQVVISSRLTGITSADFEAGIQGFKEVVASLFAGRSVNDVFIERITEFEVRRSAHSADRRLLATTVEVIYRVVGFSSATQAEEASVTASASGRQLQSGLMATGQFNNLQSLSIEVLSTAFGDWDLPELGPVDTTSMIEVDAMETPEKSSWHTSSAEVDAMEEKSSWHTSSAFIAGTTVGALAFFAVVVAMFVIHRRREHGFAFDSRSKHFNTARKSRINDEPQRETQTNQRGESEAYIDSHFMLGDEQQAEVTFLSYANRGEVARTDLENVLLEVWDGETIELPKRASEHRDFLRSAPMDVEATLVYVTTLD